MDNARVLMAQLDTLFHPKSVAVVGVPKGMKTGRLFLTALLDQGYPGHIYPVNPQAKEIDGLKAYPSVTSIPGAVDLAIVLVPHDRTLSVIRECATKGVKGAVLFTAGYKETGTDEGKSLEEELVRVARSSGMRLIGPNCMGFHCPKTGLSFFPRLSREPGHVGIISHSGSLANILGRIASQSGIRFSKVVRLGNECDLTSADFLTYLGRDPDTLLIGTYLEGIKDGPFFLNALWADLWDPKYKGKVAVSRFIGRTIMMCSLYATGGKELKNEKKAWEALEALVLDQKAKYIASSELLGTMFEQGEVVMAPYWHARSYQWKKAGIPVEYTSPKEGAVAEFWGYAIPKGVKDARKEYAGKWIAEAIGPRVGVGFAKDIFYAGCNLNIKYPLELASLLLAKEEFDALKTPDYLWIAKNIEPWTERFNKLLSR